MAGGSFVADGNGNITGGSEDGNFGDGIFSMAPFNGDYSIGADGRGIANLTTTRGNVTFRFAMVSNSLGRLIEFDGSAVGSGILEKQDSTAFSRAAVDGTYVFLLDGFDCKTNCPERLAIAGEFTASGGIISGISDANHQSSVSLNQALTGQYDIAATGRGFIDFTTSEGVLNTVFYVVSANRLLILGLDFFPVLSGVAERQTGGPFSISSFEGMYMFGLTSFTATRPQKLQLAQVGSLQISGNGSWNGTFDETGPTGISQGMTFQGTYAVDVNGRGTATLPSSSSTNIVLYAISSGSAFMLRTDAAQGSNVTAGTMYKQAGGAFTTGGLNGTFAFLENGSAPTNVSGVISTTALSPNLNVTEDISQQTLSPNVQTTGTYSVLNSTGIASASIQGGPANLHVYFVSPAKWLLIGLDAGQPLFGIAEEQQ